MVTDKTIKKIETFLEKSKKIEYLKSILKNTGCNYYSLVKALAILKKQGKITMKSGYLIKVGSKVKIYEVKWIKNTKKC